MKFRTTGELLLGTALFFLTVLPLLNAQSNFSVLHSFTAVSASSPYTNSDGTYPKADLIQSSGILYGTTFQGGSSGRGTIFRLNTNGTGFTNLHSFSGSDGSVVCGGLILSGNTLFGMAWGGGSSSSGTIFSTSTNGAGFTVLHTFTNSDGANPYGTLILAGNTLYGTASGGGLFGNGTVFALSTNGAGFTVLHHFTATTYSPTYNTDVNTDGADPRAGLILSGNTLYGTADEGGSAGAGTVFSLNTDGTGFTVLHTFTNSDGKYPQTALILSGNTLYGTVGSGGSSGFGTVFSLNTNGTGFTVLHSFTNTSDGLMPHSDLIVSGNTLYGTTEFGGSAFNGNVFSLNTDGTGFASLYEFTATVNSTNSDGTVPQAGLILLGNTLYGVATEGGGAGKGTVFALSMTPKLGIATAGNQVVVSWLPWASSFGLQTTTNLPSGSWSNVTNGITTNSAGYVFTNTVNGKAAFFRLKAP